MSVQMLGASSLNSAYNHRDVNPGCFIINLGEAFENRQLQLISQGDAKNKESIAQLKVLNNALNQVITCHTGAPDQERLQAAIGELNAEFPELEFHDFLENYTSYNETHWQACKTKIADRQKVVLEGFKPNMMILEEYHSDMKKVHDIIKAMLDQLERFLEHLVSKQNVR